MPWGIRKKGDRWEIFRKDTGAHVGFSKSRRDAAISVSIREKAARKKGEKLHQPIRSMSDFVRKVNLTYELNQVELEEIEIEGRTYARMPDSVFHNLSGNFAAAFGVKTRGGKGYVPKEKLEALVKLDKEITEEMEK